MSSGLNALPVAVIGAGPVGLAAAAELVRRDQEVVVFERGEFAADGVRSWGHVRLFSSWAELTSTAGVALLDSSGWAAPDPTRYPTGNAWVRQYLAPLAAALGDRVRTGAEVVGVSRLGRDLLVESGRERQPFVVHVQDSRGVVSRVLARAVIDASGTLSRPNPLGCEGYPVTGERSHADRIVSGMPDPDAPGFRDAARVVAVVGAGASALTALVALTRDLVPGHGSRVLWVLRRAGVGSSYGGGEADELPARGALGREVRKAVEDGRIEVVTGFRTVAVEDDVPTGEDTRVVLVGGDGRRLPGLDQIVCVTGFRPDLSFLSEVRLDLDQRLQAPARLAAEIDPNWHSCGSVRPHGHEVLAQPDDGLYLAGMKSYGRAPSFLAMTGFEQVRSISAALSGDLDAANHVELTLPDSGVCGGAGLFDGEQDGGQDGCSVLAGPQSVSIGLTSARHGSPVSAPPGASPGASTDHLRSGPVVGRLSVLDRFLPVWIGVAMLAGLLLGRVVPGLDTALGAVDIQGVSLPIALGLLVMMYPVLAKVRYDRLESVTADTRLLAASLVLNWVLGPLLMFTLAWVFLPDLPTYRTGLIVVGLARCIAMVIIWNDLACGDREAAAVLVAINSLFQVVMFAVLGWFYLAVLPGWLGLDQTGLDVSPGKIAGSVLVFLGLPLLAGYLSRRVGERARGRTWYEEAFLPRIAPWALYGLLFTIVILFALQGHQITAHPADVARIAAPLLAYFAVMWGGGFVLGTSLGLGYERTTTLAFTAAGNNFELAIAVAIATFGVTSGQALAGVVGPLIEVPVLVGLVYVSLALRARSTVESR